jgi:Afadin- and alpha -actinin-Binding
MEYTINTNSLKREAEQRENLVMTIRTLRAQELSDKTKIESLQTRANDLDRTNSILQGQERAFKATLRATENSVRSYKEEALRMKTMLQQVRTQCANDVRKRDVQIQRLKQHVTTQQRGTKPVLSQTLVTITPMGAFSAVAAREEEVDTMGDGYDLRQETTEFLTQLSQTLSDENDNLIGLVRSSLTTLQTLQGLPTPSTSQQSESEERMDYDEAIEPKVLTSQLPTSYEELATEMDNVLSSLRALLTNPSFVPIEEVEIREEEIHRLREGWEMMGERWKDAVMMMEGWKKRMAGGGKNVDLEELKMGLGLGVGLRDGFSPIKLVKPAAGGAENNADDIVEESEDGGMEEILEEDEDEVDDEDEVEQDFADDQEIMEPEQLSEDDEPDEVLGVGLQPDGTVVAQPTYTSSANTSFEIVDLIPVVPNEPVEAIASKTTNVTPLSEINTNKQSPDKTSDTKGKRVVSIESKIPRTVSLINLGYAYSTKLIKSQSSKRKLPAASTPAPTSSKSRISPSAIQRKLELAEAEAVKASAQKPSRAKAIASKSTSEARREKGERVKTEDRRKREEASKARREARKKAGTQIKSTTTTIKVPTFTDEAGDDVEKTEVKEKKRMSKSRRRSTLSPQELESLMMGALDA